MAKEQELSSSDLENILPWLIAIYDWVNAFGKSKCSNKLLLYNLLNYIQEYITIKYYIIYYNVVFGRLSPDICREKCWSIFPQLHHADPSITSWIQVQAVIFVGLSQSVLGTTTLTYPRNHVKSPTAEECNRKLKVLFILTTCNWQNE